MRVAYILFIIMAISVVALFTMPSIRESISTKASLMIMQPQIGITWQVNDTIKLTPGWVEWTEQRYNPEPSQLIKDSYWFEYHTREYLINTNDLFLKFDETFNWTKVNDAYLGFNNWTDFEKYVTDDPIWWLSWSWDLDSTRYGISANQTFIDIQLENDIAFVTVWCHITRVAEYLIGWSLGIGESFDLRSISLGKLETYEYCLDYTLNDRTIYVHFSAPSNILQPKGESFTATIYIDPLKQRKPSEWERNIIVLMPQSTEVIMATAVSNSSIVANIGGNTAVFTLRSNETLPTSFTVVSAPYQKNFRDLFFDQLVSSDVVATIIGFVILFPSSLQGIKMIRRRKTYNRLMDLIVTVYNEYKSNPETFEKEMNNLTESIFKAFIDNKIADDQLERLLNRRDDIVARM